MRRTPFTLLELFVVGTLAAGVLALTFHQPRVQAPEVLGAQLSNNGDGEGHAKQGDKVRGRDKRNFTIAGDVAGLYPGSTKHLVLLVSNPNNFAIRVVDLQVHVDDVDTACPVSAITAEPFSGMPDIAKDDSAFHTVELTMSTAAGDDCKNSTFHLTYSGTAEKA